MGEKSGIEISETPNRFRDRADKVFVYLDPDPAKDEIMIDLRQLPRGGLRQSIVEAFRNVQPGAGEGNPSAKSRVVLDHWEIFQGQVLPLLLQAAAP